MSNKQDCKVFVGGLSWETSDQKLRMYFENYGNVTEAFVNYDRNTGRPRGFGFVVFEDPGVADKVVVQQHTIDRREVEAKKAVPKEEHQAKKQSGEIMSQRSKKVFVGGLAPSVDEKAFREYFERYGMVKDAVVMYDHENKRPRGFGFVTFQDDESVAKVFNNGVMQTLHDKKIEIKHAVPRDQMAASRGGPATAAFAAGRGFPAGRGAGYGYQSQFGGLSSPAYGRGGFPKYGVGGRGSMMGSVGPAMGMNGGYRAMGGGSRGVGNSMQLGLGGSLGRGAPPGMGSNMTGMPGVQGGFASGLGSYGNIPAGYGVNSMSSFSNSGGGLNQVGGFGGAMNGYNQMPSAELGPGNGQSGGKVGSGMTNFPSLSGHSPNSGYGGFSPTGQSGVPGIQGSASSGLVNTDSELDSRTLSLNPGAPGVSATAGLSYDNGAFSEGPAPGWSS
ncbi:hypothetical protein BSKO_10192 [Bryopsis sp. KO-2023]|nr:hypothetical protein BSKO_10192 [Bryopsis sp. KO-2023]